MIFQRYLIAGIVGLATFPVAAVEPVDGVITEPRDWDCAYAYSETNCASLMQQWANDVGIEGEIVELDACGECVVKMEKGYEGTKFMVGHTCDQIGGHEIKTDTPHANISVYRDGGVQGGWKITNWEFQRCLFAFECSSNCASTGAGPQCFITSGYYVGRWMPTLAGTCVTSNSNDADESEDPSNVSGSSGQYSSGSSAP